MVKPYLLPSNLLRNPQHVASDFLDLVQKHEDLTFPEGFRFDLGDLLEAFQQDLQLEAQVKLDEALAALASRDQAVEELSECITSLQKENSALRQKLSDIVKFAAGKAG